MLFGVSIVVLGPEQHRSNGLHIALILEDVGVVTWNIDSIQLTQNVVETVLV